MDRQVEIVAYRPQWVDMFNNEAERLHMLLGTEALAVHHIGSTSVPGLKAKPIIDLLVEVKDIERIDKFNDTMREHGYEVMGEYGMPRRRYFRRTVNGRRMAHVHTWQQRDIEINRHIAFRDYLITYPHRAQAYGDLKQSLVEQFNGDKEQYIDNKDAFCKETERRALAWQAAITRFELKCERLTLIPLSAAQLYFCLERPEQLEAELGFPISRPAIEPPVVKQALRVKKQRLINSPMHEFAWHTYWIMVIASEPFGAGLIGFKGTPDKNGEVEIGYGIDASRRNQGYTTAAAKMLVDWALNQKACCAVTAWSNKENKASARVLQKVGLEIGRETEDQYCWVIGGR
ncbi:MAG: bifunctional GrpB family protein/GNAT family N-acetyltransferase [Candidatus Promineifilaceae bacterium]|nr:bifunctional GrpB family protein/GNAT family N-acetyltransferase [Candidatus Promineifilaceae bacterium]